MNEETLTNRGGGGAWGLSRHIKRKAISTHVNNHNRVKRSRSDRTGATVFPRGGFGGLRRALPIFQGREMRIIASLRPKPSVRGEEPHPASGDPVVQYTADRKE